MKKERLYHISKKCRPLMLAVAMLAGLVMEGWGQTSLPTIIDVGDALVRHTTTETLYVVAGQEGTLELQESGTIQDNIDGYIRWYTLENEVAGKTGLIRVGTNTNQTVLTEYENGYAWTSTGTVMPTKQVNTIIYNFTQDQINAGISIVCDASSVMGTIDDSGNLTPRVVSIRHIYNVVDAAATGSRNDVMEGKKSSFAELHIEDGRSDISPLLNSLNPKNYLLYQYEIHTPIPEKTLLSPGEYYTDYSNFRLPERVTNYFVKDNTGTIVAANGVRWTFYGSNGKKLDGDDFQVITNESRVNLSLYQDGLSQTEKHTRYVLVEVANGTGSGSKFKPSSDWYPVSLLNVTLEPYSKALTAEKLKEKENDPNYEDRLVALELDPVHYKQIASISFEEKGDTLLNPEATLIEDKIKNFKDFSLGPFTEGSYYAFAEPQLAPYKEKKRITATRGEYVLYRTLGYPNISRYTSDKITIDGVKDCQYIDFFMSTNGRYRVKVTDRLWEKTGGEQSGYFMFLDATDEAGVITKIAIKDQLCENTSLIVSAWICDLSFDVRNPKVVQSDVALTFKKRNKDGDETILSKFYTGELIRQPEYGNEYTTSAQWQQVSFKFTINESLGDDEEYLVEIANNSRGSSGADYGIDDIQVFKTLPNITVQREDACDASTLTVSSNYETLLRNMGYTSGEPTITDWSTIDDKLLMYRLGLNGAPDYNATDSKNFLKKSTFESYIFNSYYSFVEGLDDSRPEAKAVDITNTTDLDEDLDPIILDSTDLETDENKGKDVFRWVRINKSLKSYSPMVVFSYRTIITTRAPGFDVGTTHYDYVTTAEDAQKLEYIFNLRALQDYNYLVENWDNVASNFTGISGKPSWLGEKLEIPASLEGSDYVTFADADLARIANLDPMTEEQEKDYEGVMHQFWAQFEIPRIRVPWYDKENNIMYLHKMDVSNTDLKYEGEVVKDSEGNSITATGNYHVVLQNALAVGGGTVNVKDICTLISPFKIYTPVKISVEATASTNVYACAGTLRKISADLVSKDDEDQLDETVYSFDWYLGSIESYNLVKEDGYYLRDMLERLRTDYSSVFGADFGYDEVNAWQPTVEIDIKIKDVLLGLLDPDNPMLVINKKDFQLRLTSPSIVAMPFITGTSTGTSGIETEYCMEITEVPIPAYSTHVPQLHPGFTPTNITYPFKGEVSLRLGYPVMDDAIQLVVPLQDGFGTSMADEAESLGLADPDNGASIVLSSVEDGYPVIGTAVSMSMKETDTNTTVTIKFDSEKVKSLLHEGRRYDLLIPFVQFDGNNNQLLSACDGLLSLPVKIVPEYLTWKGDAGDKWYDEGKWNQSTKKELYFNGWDGTEAGNDANGSDNIAEAYSPLYFTKITIPEGRELTMNTVGSEADDSRFMAGWATDSSDSIRFEMAVDKGSDGNLKIVPYYINKVDQIYFKPEASIYRQDYLTYEKAWVDFEMKANTPYWMSAPLQDVYAGDMYAPSSNGRQETEAFEDITYNGVNEEGNDLNSRWSPAFYQKAWNKAIAYVNSGTSHDANNATDVEAVKSNWSIEYNDVWVPYSEGKGFYARVEDLPEANETDLALVRLPKADTKYSYEASTRASDNLSNPNGDVIDRSNAYTLMDKVNGNSGIDITIDLSDETDADGDGEHFLIGNPYMGYLDMNAFFAENKDVLADKFWTLDREAGSIIVGTPDVVDWDDENTTGYVAPMTAFFVELKDGATSKEITFTTSMIAQKPTTTDNVYTKSYSATNPTLTITAERGETRSVAKLLTSDKAENGYRASEDAVVLLDSELDAPMVYTVAGSRAAQVNAVKKISNIGLGVYNAGDDEATLTISGISRMATPLYLYDAATRQSMRLEGDSYELRVSGDSHGRYFLRDAELGDELENTISIYSARPGEVIVSSLRPVKDIRVFALNGSQVRRFSVNTTRYTFTLPAGIYMIQATDGECGQTDKVLVR